MSLVESNSSSSRRVAPSRSATSGATADRLWYAISIPKARARSARATPIAPIPTMPSRRPCKPVPSIMNMPHCQGVPALISRSPSPSRRVTMSTSAIARSAVASVSTPGVLVTVTPRARQAGTSMLLYPTATLATILQGRCRVEECLVDTVGEQGDRVVGGGQLLVANRGRDHLVAGPRPHVADLAEQVETGFGNAAGDNDPRFGHAAPTQSARRCSPSSIASTPMPE